MSYYVRRSGRAQRNFKPRSKQSVQKPNGVISSRVQKVGGEHFAIVCVDPAKHRSEWMMAGYFGNLLIEPQTVEHQSVYFDGGHGTGGVHEMSRRPYGWPLVVIEIQPCS